MTDSEEQTPGGYPMEILEESKREAKYTCVICKLVLKNPVQSYCGHRFCKQCLIGKLRDSNDDDVICALCQEEENVTECSVLKLDKTFPDNAIRREMASLEVKCYSPDCVWSGVFKNFETHLASCDFLLIPCPDCGSLVAKNKMDQHRTDGCSANSGGGTASCPVGCNQNVEESQLNNHLLSNLAEHFKLLITKLQNLEKLVGQHSGDKSIIQQIRDLEGLAQRHASQARQDETGATGGATGGAVAGATGGATGGEASIGVEAMVASIVDKMNIYEGVITVLNREVEKVTLQVDAIERQSRSDKDQLETMDKKVKSLERMLAMKDATIAELDLRITSLESTSYDGTLLWRITDFQRRRQEAISGRTTSIYSPTFYTSRTGYKMCARIYLNGDGMGKGTHVSLFFVLLRGHFDALLKWPFRQKVSLMFLDQSNRENIVDAFRPDPTSSSFKRPSTEMNIASGCPLFMPLTQLDSSQCNYVKDNTAFVKIIVNMEDV